MIRFAFGIAVTAGLVLFMFLQQSRLPAELTISRQLSGEHWYAINLTGRHAGYLHTSATGLPDGGWRYSTHTHILLDRGLPLNIHKEMDFSGGAPWHLRHAEQRTRRGRANEERIRFDAIPDGLRVTGPQGQVINTLETPYTLSDFLRLERWLTEESPRDEQRIKAPGLVFEQGGIRSTTYALVERSNDGYVLRSEASIGATLTRLDTELLPVSIDVGEVFSFELADQATAVAIASPAFKDAYLLPVNERIVQPQEIESMTLTAVDESTGQAILTIEARRQWRAEAQPAQVPARSLPEQTLDALMAEARIDDAGISDAERIERLFALVRDRVHYREGVAADSLDEVLERGFGECTDFADLFTVLAEHAGIAARTVIGLAYQDRTPYGFAFHAWNEIRVDDEWQVIDPTWGQRLADATHLPLADRDLATLKVYGSRQSASINVSRIIRSGT